MCGRYSLYSEQTELEKRFDCDSNGIKLSPRYNQAPGQDAAIVKVSGPSRLLCLMHWGLVPSWAKDPKIGNHLINARSETAASKPSFRSAFRKRRCLVPADGFYEWKKIKGGKQPINFQRRDRQPFAMAGLWEIWHQGKEDELTSFTILTTAANRVVSPVHDRMPVILPRDQEAAWLDPELEDPQLVQDLLKPLAAQYLEFYAVSERVNRPTVDEPGLVDPLST